MSGLSSSNFAANEMCLSGRVAADGTNVAGQGFTSGVVGVPAGTFTITISTVDKYAAVSSCVVSCDGVDGIASFGAPTVTDGRLVSFTVKTQAHDANAGVLLAKPFSFVAILQE